MSQHVSFYVEKKDETGDCYWKLLNKSSFVWDFERYYFDSDISFSQFGYIENCNLSAELKTMYKIGMEKYDYITAKETTFSELWELANKYIEKFEMTAKNAYLALGVPYREDEYDCNYEDKYDENDRVRPDYNPLTYPVNKEILEKLNDYFFNIGKAYRLIELCRMVKEFYNIKEEDEDNYRVILILS